MTTATLPRQTCSVCLQPTTDYTTELVDRRTAAQKRAGRAERLARFHTCRSCAVSAERLRDYKDLILRSEDLDLPHVNWPWPNTAAELEQYIAEVREHIAAR